MSVIMAMSKPQGRQVEVEAKVIGETDVALQLDNGPHRQGWVPKRRIKRTAMGRFSMPEELARAKGFRFYAY